MMKSILVYRIVDLVLMICLLLCFNGEVLAHGAGDEQIVGEKAGPYYVTVWSTSDSGSGDLHFTVAVGDLEERPVLDALVVIEVSAFGSSQSEITQEATTKESANKFRYETDFSSLQTGVYSITVIISGVAGEGSISFNMEHSYKKDASWWYVLVLLSVIVLGVFGFLSRRKTILNASTIVH